MNCKFSHLPPIPHDIEGLQVVGTPKKELTDYPPCHKYKFKRQNKESLAAFLEKLKEKSRLKV